MAAEPTNTLFGGANDFRVRLRRIRLIRRWDQKELAERTGMSNSLVSGIETGKVVATGDQIEAIAKALGYSPEFLTKTFSIHTTRPWLRAYADASKREADARIALATLAAEYIRALNIKPMPDLIAHFAGDPHNPHDIDDAAEEMRTLAGIEPDAVVGNATRAAERLGCVVLPLESELGRHLGMSVRADQLPIMCIAKAGVPGDRQRFTVAHELGHLMLHSNAPPPRDSAQAATMEAQANRFAGAFLAPGDSLLESIETVSRGRVTLGALADVKAIWGVSIKGLVGRYRELGLIDANQAQSLYRQISSRKWTKVEPVHVETERAQWLARTVGITAGTTSSLHQACRICAEKVGGNAADLEALVDWEVKEADVLPMTPRRRGK